jgi:hypothetical protein
MTIESSNTALDSSTEHTIRRLRVRLGRSYDDAIADFERVVPLIDPLRFQSLDSWEKNLQLSETVALRTDALRNDRRTRTCTRQEATVLAPSTWWAITRLPNGCTATSGNLAVRAAAAVHLRR